MKGLFSYYYLVVTLLCLRGGDNVRNTMTAVELVSEYYAELLFCTQWLALRARSSLASFPCLSSLPLLGYGCFHLDLASVYCVHEAGALRCLGFGLLQRLLLVGRTAKSVSELPPIPAKEDPDPNHYRVTRLKISPDPLYGGIPPPSS